MVTLLQLTVDIGSLTQFKTGGVFGPIYFKVGTDFSFPAKDWTDFVPPFIRAWLEALITLTSTSTRKASVWFMDGPYTVELSLSEPGIVDVKFVRGHLNGSTALKSAEAELKQLLENAIGVGEKVLEGCRQMGWTTNDTDPITSAIQKGADILAQI